MLHDSMLYNSMLNNTLMYVTPCYITCICYVSCYITCKNTASAYCSRPFYSNGCAPTIAWGFRIWTWWRIYWSTWVAAEGLGWICLPRGFWWSGRRRQWSRSIRYNVGGLTVTWFKSWGYCSFAQFAARSSTSCCGWYSTGMTRQYMYCMLYNIT